MISLYAASRGLIALEYGLISEGRLHCLKRFPIISKSSLLTLVINIHRPRTIYVYMVNSSCPEFRFYTQSEYVFLVFCVVFGAVDRAWTLMGSVTEIHYLV